MHIGANGRPLYDSGSALSVLAWATTTGILMSTEYLVQPFIWRGWPLSEIFVGWLHIAADRLFIAISIALCVIAAREVILKSRWLLTPAMILAVLLGAILGESLRVYFDPFAEQPGVASFVGRILHWALVGSAMAGVLGCWRLNAKLAASAAEEEAASTRAHRMLIVSELDALQRQIEPHFLFNTLATIKRFGQTAPLEGYDLLERLFDYISTTFAASQKHESSLGAELDLVEAYLDVCAVRMGSRLSVVCEIEPALRASRFPPLMLGTLVENALKHGLAPVAAGGTITLRAQRNANALEVCVCDDGVGFRKEGGNGIGLANLSARLRTAIWRECVAEARSIGASRVRATLRIPHAFAN